MVVTQMSPEIYSAYRIGVGSPSAIFRLAPLAPPLDTPHEAVSGQHRHRSTVDHIRGVLRWMR